MISFNIGLTWPFNDNFAYQEITAIRDTTLWNDTLKYAVVAAYSSIDSTLLWPFDFLLSDTLGIIVDYNEGGSQELTGATINGKTYGTITAVESEEAGLIDFDTMNYPNPFNHSAKINYTLKMPAHTKIQIFDLLGKEIQSFDMGFQQIGTYDRLWQGESHEGEIVTSGIYYYLVKSENRILYRGSMTFVK